MSVPYSGPITILDNSGNPVDGAYINTYEAGTSTRKAVYTTAARDVAHTNPFQATNGRATFFLGTTGAYRIEVTDQLGVVLPAYSVDNVQEVEATDPTTAVNAVKADLLSTTDAAKGAGMSGFSPSLAYAFGTTGAAIQATGIYVDHYVSDATNATAGINTALTLAAVRGGVVVFGRKTYTTTGFTVPDGVSIVGQGAREVGDSGTEDNNGGTTISVDATGTTAAITFGGRNVKASGFKLVNANASVGGRGIYAPEAYFVTMSDVYVEGFSDGLLGSKALYWLLTGCRFSANTRGATFTGSAGVWNTDWFNNAQIAIGCQFNGNTEHGLKAKAVNMTLIGCAFEKCANSLSTPTSGRGLWVEGDSTSYPGQVTVINPYVEQTWMPFTFTFCRATIMDGFSQGWGSAPSGSALVDATNSTVQFIGQLYAFDLFANRFRLRTSSRVLVPALPGVASTNDIDGTSSVVITGVDEGSFTGTLTGCTTSPTGTLRYTRSGSMVTLYVPTINATSNTTACTITGLPASITPTTTQRAACNVTDSGAAVRGTASVDSSGVITLSNGAIGAAFTNTGTKGVQESVFSYILV